MSLASLVRVFKWVHIVQEMALALGAMEALDSTAPMESKPQAEIAMSALDERIYKRARKGK